MASEKYEADDIINTLSINNRKYGISNTILTNDKDLFQTIYDDDFWWDLNNKKYNHKDLKKKLSFSPQNLTDFLGLMGDSVDNIPGAPGIGEKTAAVLINKYKNIDNIFDNINLISSDLGKKFHRYVNIIIENKEIIYLSKKLATLEYIDTIKSDNKLFERHEVNLEEVDSFLTKTGMRLGQKDSWINQIKSLCEVI